MSKKTIILVGNPNAGKTTLFNQLSGLYQKTGNYPGITVEKKKGVLKHNSKEFTVIDLPGTYSLYPSSLDEEVVLDSLLDYSHQDYPDLIVVVGDIHSIKKSLFLYQQVKDLGIPVILTLNQIDDAERKGIHIQKNLLTQYFDSPVILISARKGLGIKELKDTICSYTSSPYSPSFQIPAEYKEAVQELDQIIGDGDHNNLYHSWLYLAQSGKEHSSAKYKSEIASIIQKHKLIPRRLQLKETIQRHLSIDGLIEKIIHKEESAQSLTQKLDKLTMHPFWGYVIFLVILFSIFQALFFLASYPQDWIETGIADLCTFLISIFPEGPLSDLVTSGIVPGIGAMLVFLPQIILLFFFLLLMEESGYMVRVVYLMDRWFRPLGLNGKSVVPLLSSAACAIPAIMSTRNIENPKERLITILVAPFITCSARLPVYAVIIPLIIPKGNSSFFNYQGVALMAMYLLGVVMAFLSAVIANKILKSTYKSYLVLDIPNYKMPYWKNVLYGMFEKAWSFVSNAGKIIVALSIILWALGSYGYEYDTQEQKGNFFAEPSIEYSYLGKFGKAIEPVFKPLGYDWKMDISILSSFAAREVFVPVLASIYNIDDYEEEDGKTKLKLRELMQKDINPATGEPTFNLATGVSILLFYAFAMQCASTLAVVKKETHSWKWPLIQLFFMTGIAYLSALIAYQVLK